MATDLVQRAAAICGLDNPNSDQLAAWFRNAENRTSLELNFDSQRWWADVTYLPSCSKTWRGFITESTDTLLDCLAAAVVEVDRIEREAKQP
jgi:hypothetical protein